MIMSATIISLQDNTRFSTRIIAVISTNKLLPNALCHLHKHSRAACCLLLHPPVSLFNFQLMKQSKIEAQADNTHTSIMNNNNNDEKYSIWAQEFSATKVTHQIILSLPLVCRRERAAWKGRESKQKLWCRLNVKKCFCVCVRAIILMFQGKNVSIKIPSLFTLFIVFQSTPAKKAKVT